MKKILIYFLLFSALASLLFGVFKGKPGNPLYFQIEKDTSIGGPFESTNSSSRYALVEAIVERGSFFFTDEEAHFSAPDMVRYNGNSFSIFTPGVSFFVIPFYMIGTLFLLPQLFSYLSTFLIALLNIFLIAWLSKKIGVNYLTGILSGAIFLFATNGLAYSSTLTQHHFSTALVLLSLIVGLSKVSFINDLLFGLLFGAGILVDIPNAIFMFPVGIYLLSKHFSVSESGDKFKLNIKTSIIAALIGLLPFLGLFGWYNKQLTGSYTQIGQSIGRSDYIQKPENKQINLSDYDPYVSSSVYNTRSQINGFYILLFSDERGWFYYSPVLLIGILGFFIAFRKKEIQEKAGLLSAVIFVDLVSYSMFGDPWGGWSFGPRYLIPATAVLCSGIGIAVSKFGKKWFFIILFFLLLFYSVAVSSLGALTTNAIPPKIEAIHLDNPIPYTYEYNLELINKNFTGSLVYNVLLSGQMTARSYLYIYIGLVFGLLGIIYLSLFSTNIQVQIKSIKTIRPSFNYFRKFKNWRSRK